MTRQFMRIRKPNVTWNLKQGAVTSLSTQVALTPEVAKATHGAATGGSIYVQAERIRLHLARLARQLNRATCDEHRACISLLIDTDIQRLALMQAKLLADHDSGKINLNKPLTFEPKQPISLLPRGSVPRGFNT